MHLHTPGSADYEQAGVSFLDILQQAERRGLDIIAFTDHNTVNGYRQMMREIADLELLERLQRIQPDELGRLLEYRRLLKKILVLPGFEFTSTFGFHILGIFPPDKPLRDIEYLLYEMHVPGHVLDKGLTEAGATSDVLTAYRLIDEAGGIAIAAHANSSSGVLMRGVNIGGQTRIAFTQDSHLLAVELTDLNKGRRSMAHWLSGAKTEYPRRMHLIQGSDAHRLTALPGDHHRLGVGDRTSEVLLPERSFAALRALFLSQDFHRVRQSRAPLNVNVDPLKDIRAQNAGPTLAFHSALPRRSANRFEEIIRDAAAMANGTGGVIVIGCEAGVDKKPKGVPAAEETARKLSAAFHERVQPELKPTIVVQTLDEAQVIQITVPQTGQAPYAVDQHQFYVRDGAQTRPATRDELVAITKRTLESAAASHRHRERTGMERSQPQPTSQRGESRPAHQPARQTQPQPASQHRSHPQPKPVTPHTQPKQSSSSSTSRHVEPPSTDGEQAIGEVRREAPAQPAHQPTSPSPVQESAAPANGAQSAETPAGLPIIEGMPRSGVQIAAVEERDGIRHYTVRDLRNNSLVRNVTLKSARDLWHYAIVAYNTNAYNLDAIAWKDGPAGQQRAVLSRAFRAGKMRYDLALKASDGVRYIFYGVAEDGMDADWKRLIAEGQTATPPESGSPSDENTASS
ncbi:MAG: putative DNA binding domain-containing protein [Anaerolineae bacterium]|nr:putative DNA binding domain-containing protein [Thermoflexales bacterium]MDW8407313.1 putative DNA binding domain-containing protein [Anaerolineae bacterium]